jgi:hypothetical protein
VVPPRLLPRRRLRGRQRECSWDGCCHHRAAAARALLTTREGIKRAISAPPKGRSYRCQVSWSQVPGIRALLRRGRRYAAPPRVTTVGLLRRARLLRERFARPLVLRVETGESLVDESLVDGPGCQVLHSYTRGRICTLGSEDEEGQARRRAVAVGLKRRRAPMPALGSNV